MYSQSLLAYTPKDIILSKAEFQRYIKPQLRSITNDYYQLLSILNPEIKNMKTTAALFKKLRLNATDSVELCKTKKNEKCSLKLKEVIENIQGILNKNPEQPALSEKEYLNSRNLLKGYKSFQTFHGHTFELKSQINNILYLYTLNLLEHKDLQNLARNIDQSESLYNLYILNSSDYRFRDKFISYWNSFIKPVNRKIIVENDMLHFTRILNELNLSWNELNIELTKRNKVVSKQVKSLLKTMHNRWNNILKVTLR